MPLERTEAETRSQEGEGGVLEDTATAWQQRRKRTAFGGRWLNVRTCGGCTGSSAQKRETNSARGARKSRHEVAAEKNAAMEGGRDVPEGRGGLLALADVSRGYYR